MSRPQKARAAALAGCCVVALAGGIALAQEKPATAGLEVHDIDVRATALPSFEKDGTARTRYGKLEWRGGLVLSSGSEHFGGWSGLVFDPDGERFLAVSDSGSWMTARLVHDGGRPKAVEAARIGPLLTLAGKGLSRNRDRDAESAVLVQGTFGKGSLFVAFEQNNRIGHFPMADGEPGRPISYVPMPAEARRMRGSGFEAVTKLQGGASKGALVALAEFPLRGETHHAGWIWIGGLPKRFSIVDIGDFGLTDAASLSDGSLLVLERRFRWSEGVKMRLRRFAAKELKPGAVLEGEVLIEADMAREIDNMECLAVRETADGETLITMLSDDNFNKLFQRTLLLEFALVGGDKTTSETAPQPEARDGAAGGGR